MHFEMNPIAGILDLVNDDLYLGAYATVPSATAEGSLYYQTVKVGLVDVGLYVLLSGVWTIVGGGTPVDPASYFELEDGSGHFELEDGSGGYILE